MQESYINKRKVYCEALGKVLLKLREETHSSARMIACSIEMSKTTLLLAEQGKLDPQLSTFCRISEAYNLLPSELLKLVEKELPPNWSYGE